jgi:hypothetical protein
VNQFTLDQRKGGGSFRCQTQKSNGVCGIKAVRIRVSQKLVTAACGPVAVQGVYHGMSAAGKS